MTSSNKEETVLKELSKLAANIVISNQPQPEKKRVAQHHDPYQKTIFKIYAEKGANIFTSSTENPANTVIRNMHNEDTDPENDC